MTPEDERLEEQTSFGIHELIGMLSGLTHIRKEHKLTEELKQAIEELERKIATAIKAITLET